MRTFERYMDTFSSAGLIPVSTLNQVRTPYYGNWYIHYNLMWVFCCKSPKDFLVLNCISRHVGPSDRPFVWPRQRDNGRQRNGKAKWNTLVLKCQEIVNNAILFFQQEKMNNLNQYVYYIFFLFHVFVWLGFVSKCPLILWWRRASHTSVSSLTPSPH